MIEKFIITVDSDGGIDMDELWETIESMYPSYKVTLLRK